MESSFRVQKVAFDQVKGLGSTPNNQEIMYHGFAVEMKPSSFFRIVTDEDRSEDAAKFVQFIKRHVPFGSPTLIVRTNLNEWQANNTPLRVSVKSHEGRGRMRAFDKVNGNTPIPVHIIIYGGVRASHLSPEFFTALRNNGFVHQNGDDSTKPTEFPLGRIFWNGKTL
jgi:hypothetical protein